MICMPWAGPKGCLALACCGVWLAWHAHGSSHLAAANLKPPFTPKPKWPGEDVTVSPCMGPEEACQCLQALGA